MANDVSLALRIATVLDASGINKADKSVKNFEKRLKSLGKTLGVTLSVAAVTAYGKAAVRAFAEDEKAALSLARTVQNLGLGFEAQGAAVNDYLSTLEKQTGVLDDELRPAMDRLLRATLDITKAQELLNLSLDIAAGTGKSVTQVSQSLQKAYLGQTQAIGRLGVGLSKAELQGAKFEDIQKRLMLLFSGQAQDAANSYAGQIDRLTIASNNAKETIGEGLVKSLIILSGSGDIDGLVGKMERFSESVANASVEVSKLIAGFKFIFNPKNLFKSGEEFQRMLDMIEMGKPVRQFNISNNAVTGYKLDKKRQEEAIKAAKAQIKTSKALTAEQKKQAALKKAGTIFDLDQIQAIAALKGQLSAEDRKRVEAQLALMNENDALAQKLTREILMAQDATGGLYRYFLTIGDTKIKNPFEYLDKWLEDFQAKLNALKFPTAPTVSGAVAPTSGVIVGFKPQDMGVIPTAGPIQGPQIPATNASAYTGTIPTGNFTYGQGNPLNTNVYVTVQGSVTTEDDLVNKIASGLQQKSLSTGDSAYINRRTGGFAG